MSQHDVLTNFLLESSVWIGIAQEMKSENSEMKVASDKKEAIELISLKSNLTERINQKHAGLKLNTSITLKNQKSVCSVIYCLFLTRSIK